MAPAFMQRNDRDASLGSSLLGINSIHRYWSKISNKMHLHYLLRKIDVYIKITIVLMRKVRYSLHLLYFLEDVLTDYTYHHVSAI